LELKQKVSVQLKCKFSEMQRQNFSECLKNLNFLAQSSKPQKIMKASQDANFGFESILTSTKSSLKQQTKGNV